MNCAGMTVCTADHNLSVTVTWVHVAGLGGSGELAIVDTKHHLYKKTLHILIENYFRQFDFRNMKIWRLCETTPSNSGPDKPTTLHTQGPLA